MEREFKTGGVRELRQTGKQGQEVVVVLVEDHSGGYEQGEDEGRWKVGEEEAVDGFSQEDPNNPGQYTLVSPHKTV